MQVQGWCRGVKRWCRGCEVCRGAGTVVPMCRSRGAIQVQVHMCWCWCRGGAEVQVQKRWLRGGRKRWWKGGAECRGGGKVVERWWKGGGKVVQR